MMFLDWYHIGMKGEKPNMPKKGYTWKTLPELNKSIQKQYSGVNLEKAIRLLEDSFQQVQNIISKHSNQDLFEKKKYRWTGSTSLAAYLILNTSSHYSWAIKLIKRSLK